MENSNANLVGKYINTYLYSDAHPNGKIIGTRGKTILILAKVTAEKDPAFKPDYVSGGFSAICLNSHNQEWIYTVHEDITFEIRWTPGKTKMGFRQVDEKPYNFYDYNF